MRFDLGTLDSGEPSLPFGLLVLLKLLVSYTIVESRHGRVVRALGCCAGRKFESHLGQKTGKLALST